MSPLWYRNQYMVSQMKISDYRDESENRFRSLQVYLQTFNLMIAMLIEMFPEGQNFRNGLDIFSSLSSFTLHTYIRVMRVGRDTFCDPFIQKIFQNQPSSRMIKSPALTTQAFKHWRMPIIINQGGWLILKDLLNKRVAEG